MANTAYVPLAESLEEESRCKAACVEGLAAYQVAGEVTAHQADDA